MLLDLVFGMMICIPQIFQLLEKEEKMMDLIFEMSGKSSSINQTGKFYLIQTGNEVNTVLKKKKVNRNKRLSLAVLMTLFMCLKKAIRLANFIFKQVCLLLE